MLNHQWVLSTALHGDTHRIFPARLAFMVGRPGLVKRTKQALWVGRPKLLWKLRAVAPPAICSDTQQWKISNNVNNYVNTTMSQFVKIHMISSRCQNHPPRTSCSHFPKKKLWQEIKQGHYFKTTEMSLDYLAECPETVGTSPGVPTPQLTQQPFHPVLAMNGYHPPVRKP